MVCGGRRSDICRAEVGEVHWCATWGVVCRAPHGLVVMCDLDACRWVGEVQAREEAT